MSWKLALVAGCTFLPKVSSFWWLAFKHFSICLILHIWNVFSNKKCSTSGLYIYKSLHFIRKKPNSSSYLPYLKIRFIPIKEPPSQLIGQTVNTVPHALFPVAWVDNLLRPGVDSGHIPCMSLPKTGSQCGRDHF